MHSSFTYNPNAHRASSYQQQSGYQQPIYNIGASQGFNSGFMTHTPIFVNHSFTRSFASVVSCENDFMKRQQMTTLHKAAENPINNQNSSILGSFLRRFKPTTPQYQQSPAPPPQHSFQNKEFEDFTDMPSLSANHILPNPHQAQHHYYQQPPQTNHITMNFVQNTYVQVPQSANPSNCAPVARNFMASLFGGYRNQQQQAPPKPQNQSWYKKGFRCHGGRWRNNKHARFHDHDVNLPKNVHEKERSSIERNIQDDCDFVDVMEDKETMSRVLSDDKNKPDKTAPGSCLISKTTSDDLPFTIFSLDDFPAIVAPKPRITTAACKKEAAEVKHIESKDQCDEGFVVVPTEASLSTPSFQPKRISLCEKIIKSPQRLFPPKPLPICLKPCLKPSRRIERESECSDDFIVFTDECDGDDQQDTTLSDHESDTDSEDDDSDDEMEGIEEEDEDMSDDDETLEVQIDSGVEEKKVHFNMTPKIHVMRVWDFAYRSYRKGDYWQQVARDHERFKNRISLQKDILIPVLKAAHRDRIFRERFQEP